MTTRLNPNNILIKISDVSDILKKGGINTPPKNIDFYRIGFTHKSYCNKLINIVNYNKQVIPLQPQSQEVYEFMGDSIISKTVCLYLYKRYHFFEEGNLTRLKQRIVDSKTLASLGRFLNYSKFILISKTMESTSGRNTDKLLEDTFEAFIFAIYLDLGEDIACSFVVNVMEQVIDFAQINQEDINYKHQLLEIFQKKWNLTPVYYKISEIGPPHQKCYKMAARDYLGNNLGFGISGIKRDSEQIASQKSIEYLNKVFDLMKNRELLKVELIDFKVTENDSITKTLDLIKSTIKTIGDDIDYKTTINTIESVLLNNRIFCISYKIKENGKLNNYNITIQSTKEQYKFYKLIFSDELIDSSCKDYIRSILQLKLK